MSGSITPCLWFEKDEAEEAATYYCSIFPNSEIKHITRHTESTPGDVGAVLFVEFSLNGQPFQALNGGGDNAFTPAVSWSVSCKDQNEIDYFWDRLVDGGQAVQCGWLVDRFGVSWQVVPEMMGELFAKADPQQTERVMAAMMPMIKLDIATLQAAYDSE